jgi:hypothetical protein
MMAMPVFGFYLHSNPCSPSPEKEINGSLLIVSGRYADGDSLCGRGSFETPRIVTAGIKGENVAGRFFVGEKWPVRIGLFSPSEFTGNRTDRLTPFDFSTGRRGRSYGPVLCGTFVVKGTAVPASRGWVRQHPFL